MNQVSESKSRISATEKSRRHMGQWKYLKFRPFLLLALHTGQLSVSRPGRFTHRLKKPRYPMNRRLSGTLSRPGHFEETQTPCPVHPVTKSLHIIPSLLVDNVTCTWNCSHLYLHYTVPSRCYRNAKHQTLFRSACDDIWSQVTSIIR